MQELKERIKHNFGLCVIAVSSLSAEAKVLAAAAPPLKENAVPVGMRRTDVSTVEGLRYL